MITSTTLDCMDRFGGSFVRQLAKLYRHADQDNKARLAKAFSDYFGDYERMAVRQEELDKEGAS